MVDVTVRGAGIFGLSVAWALVKSGAKVRVIDPLGVGAGSSGGVVGALAPHVPENWNEKKAFQLEALMMADVFWAGVQGTSGKDPGFGRTGRLQAIPDERAKTLALARSSGAMDLWKGFAEWHVIAKDEANPWHPISETSALIFDTLSARIHPRNACLSLAAALGALGCEIVPDGADEGLVCHATGWRGLLELSEQFGRNIGNGVKGQAALLDIGNPVGPQIFVDGIHIISHSNGTTAIGSTSERDFDDQASTDERLENVIAKARHHLPILQKANVIERWAGVRPRAMTRAPLIGRWPGRHNHFIANGGFKIGFGMAPKIADCMADLMLRGGGKIPTEFDTEHQIAPLVTD